MPGGADFGSWRQEHISRALRLAASPAASDAAELHTEGDTALLPSGCAGGGRILHEDVKPCAAGTVLCWMQCLKTTGLKCGDNAVCVDKSPLPEHPPLPVPADKMCPHPGKRGPYCFDSPPSPPSPPAPPAAPPSWCGSDGYATDMGMQGFQWGHATCYLLLFHSLDLDSPLAFYFACAGVVALGILTELLTYLRRGRWFIGRVGHTHPRLGVIVTVLLFALQTSLAYCLMLVAMTYSVQLFGAVILGLAIGHGAFNVHAPVPASADPCCIEETQTPTFFSSPKLSTGTRPLLSSMDEANLRTVLAAR